MKKRSYRAQKVNQIEWEELAQSVQDKAMVLAIAVAKVEQYGVLMDSDRQAVVTVKWEHPAETPELLERLSALSWRCLTAAMESTGVYGDTLRGQLRQAGVGIHRVSPKRVHDACEVYDGVPSLHDAKAAQVIARLYWEGASQVWVEASESQRELNAIGRLYRLYQKQYQQQQNRLEAALMRHWPEVCAYLELDSVTLEQLLLSYGSPASLTQQAEEAREQMRQVSRGQLSAEKIAAVLDSARGTHGLPGVPAEQDYLKALGAELRHNRLQREGVAQRLRALTQSDAQLHPLAQTIGQVTTGLLLAERLDPRDYANSRSYCKALGLNLKERSSGQHPGQLRLTKRGSGQARRDLYLATLRLIHRDAWVRDWYERKVQAQGGRCKANPACGLVDESCGAARALRDVWTARGQPPCCPPPAHTLGPLAHRVHRLNQQGFISLFWVGPLQNYRRPSHPRGKTQRVWTRFPSE
jgi:transposase